MRVITLCFKSILWMPILLITYLVHLIVLLIEVFIFRYINMGIKFLMDSYAEDLKTSSKNTPFEKLFDDFFKKKEE